MSNVNFVSEFNMLFRFAKNNGLSMRERMLWVSLFYIANDRAIYNEQTQTYDWPDGYFPVANSELNLYSCLDKRGIEAARNLLKQRGLIDFNPGMRNKRNPEYRLNYLSIGIGYKNVPNDVPKDVPMEAPCAYPARGQQGANDVPSEAPLPKYKEKAEEKGKQTPGDDDADDEKYRGSRAVRLIEDCARHNPYVKAVLDSDRALYKRIWRSGRYPDWMISEAVDRTSTRMEKGTVNCPMQYVQTLLDEWTKCGITSEAELAELDEDWRR